QALQNLVEPPGQSIAQLVRAKGLEPPHLAIPEPKSGASTSFATPASVAGRRGIVHEAAKGNPGRRCVRTEHSAGRPVTRIDRKGQPMATQPDIPPPDTINPQSPPETPPMEPIPEQ